MPKYEFICNHCGEQFEIQKGIFQRLDPIKCPKCGQEKPSRFKPSRTSYWTEGGSCSNNSG